MNKFNLSTWAVHHKALVLFMILALSAGGFYSFFSMGRAEDPRFTVKTMVMQVSWPGATALEMQNQVADKIEARLKSIEHLDFIETYTRPGLAIINITLLDTTPSGRVPDLWYQVRKKVGDIRHELPQGIIGPNFNDEYTDVYLALFMITAPTLQHRELVPHAEKIRSRLLTLKNIDKADVLGEEPQKIFVEISYTKLATLGIPAQAIFDSLAHQNALIPAGSIDTKTERIHVRLSGLFDSLEAIRNVPVSANGRTFRLKDIATVNRGLKDPPTFRIRHNGDPAIGIGVRMVKGANGLDVGKELKKVIENLRQELPDHVKIHQVADQPAIIAKSFQQFLIKFLAAVMIVLIISFLSLGFRAGIIVALTVPLTLAISFLIMFSLNMEFERITLGALILALGLLVDDAIIAIESMLVKIEQGWSRHEAAGFAWSSTAFPMLTGTLVTIAGFVPVGFANSAAGEYAGGIFSVVAIALCVSWFVAVVFTPYLGVVLLPKILKNNADEQDLYTSGFYRFLRTVLEFCVRNRKWVVGTTIAALVLSGAGFSMVQKQFFPQSSRPELMIDLRAAEGASFQLMEREVEKVEKLIKEHESVRFATSYIGQGAPRFWLALNPILPNDNFAQIVVMTQDMEARERLHKELTAHFQKVEGLVRARVKRFEFGPPIAWPVEFRVLGPNADKVTKIASEIRQLLEGHDATRDVELMWRKQSKIIKFELDQDRVRLLGLNSQQISQAIQSVLNGVTVTRFREGIELIDVVARATHEERLDLANLEDVVIQNRNGKALTIGQVARIKESTEDPVLWRRNRQPMMTVRSLVRGNTQAADISNSLLPAIAEIQQALPPGYRIETGGTYEKTVGNNNALFAVFPLMFLIMLTLIMIQVQSFSRMFMVFLTFPLGFIGASTALLIGDRPFGFVAILGVIALGGMIMRNTLILVDQIENDIAAGSTMREAIIESTIRRSRPVILTALAAILAFIPLSFSMFWGPMAVAMIGGLTIATVLTLLFLPALYALWFKVPQAREGTGFSETKELSLTHKELSSS